AGGNPAPDRPRARRLPHGKTARRDRSHSGQMENRLNAGEPSRHWRFALTGLLGVPASLLGRATRAIGIRSRNMAKQLLQTARARPRGFSRRARVFLRAVMETRDCGI